MIFHHSSVYYRIIQDSIAICVNLIRRFLHSFQISKRSLVKGRSSHLKICIFQRLCKLFMTYYLLEATPTGCIRNFFTIDLFSLIYGEAVLLYCETTQ